MLLLSLGWATARLVDLRHSPINDDDVNNHRVGGRDRSYVIPLPDDLGSIERILPAVVRDRDPVLPMTVSHPETWKTHRARNLAVVHADTDPLRHPSQRRSVRRAVVRLEEPHERAPDRLEALPPRE